MANPKALYGRLQKQATSLSKRIKQSMEVQQQIKRQLSQLRPVITREMRSRVGSKQWTAANDEMTKLRAKLSTEVKRQLKLESKAAAMRAAKAYMRGGQTIDAVHVYLDATENNTPRGFNDYMAIQYTSRVFCGRRRCHTHNLLRQVARHFGPKMMGSISKKQVTFDPLLVVLPEFKLGHTVLSSASIPSAEPLYGPATAGALTLQSIENIEFSNLAFRQRTLAQALLQSLSTPGVSASLMGGVSTLLIAEEKNTHVGQPHCSQNDVVSSYQATQLSKTTRDLNDLMKFGARFSIMP